MTGQKRGFARKFEGFGPDGFVRLSEIDASFGGSQFA